MDCVLLKTLDTSYSIMVYFTYLYVLYYGSGQPRTKDPAHVGFSFQGLQYESKDSRFNSDYLITHTKHG